MIFREGLFIHPSQISQSNIIIKLCGVVQPKRGKVNSCYNTENKILQYKCDQDTVPNP